MGIERFFSSIEQNNITNLESNFTYKLQKKLDSEYLLIDFNSIIHITSATVITEMNYLLYQIINKTFKNNNKVKNIIDTYGIKLDIDDNLEYGQLTSYLENNDKLSEIIYNKVEEFLLNILRNFVNPDKLKYLLIAVDGVPNKSKMLEQKKRRYMGAVISGLKHKIFEKYEDELMKDKNRYLYEKNKIDWSKIHISPGTKFMNNLDESLSESNFTSKVKNICKNLKKYEYSGTQKFGEGEKKIVNYAYENDISGGSSISIYSPDSDMSLLCLLLSNKFKNIKILRHNQQENNYDIVDIDSLRKNIFNYVSNSMKISVKIGEVKLDVVSVINDIVFVLTIFGNDFLPKMESFNVKYDFDRIIDKYIKLLQENKITYILNANNTNKISINQDAFIDLMKILHNDEGGNLQKMYMTSHYQNYDKLKKMFDVTHENFAETLNDFLKKLRTFNGQIKDGIINANNWISKEGQFIDKLMKLTRFQINIKNPADYLEFIENYMKHYEQYDRTPEVRITFRKYSRTLKDQFHKTNLERSLAKIDPKLKITKYDEEIFKLDNMLDEYAKKLNASSLDLGYVSIDQKTYVWKSEKIENSVKRYYYDFFSLNNIDVKNPEMSKMLNEYIEGLMWVFKYYYTNDIGTNNIPSMWFYKYTHAPLVTQLYYFMKNQNKDYIANTFNGLVKYEIKSSNDFFKPKEHLMYVSPINSYPYIVPTEYKNKVKTTIDINRIVDEVWTHETSDEIDCRGILFLNKCHINEIHSDADIIRSFDNDRKFISSLRN